MYQIPIEDVVNNSHSQSNLTTPNAHFLADLQEKKSTVSNFNHAAQQIFKGLAALCGLSALGGATYWLSSWWGHGTNGNGDVDDGDDKYVKSLASGSADTISSGLMVAGARMVEPTELRHQESMEVTPKQRLQSSDILHSQQETKPSEDSVFSIDDLSYRPQTPDVVLPNNQNHQRKLLGASTNDVLVLAHNQLSIGQGQAVTMTLDMLSANTTNIDPTVIFYLDSSVQQGRFEFSFNQGVAIDSFSHTELFNKFVRFVHDDSLLAPSYQIAVTDGGPASAPQNATIVFDLAPTLSSNRLIIGQGQEIVLSPTMLNATDVDTNPLNLTFISSDVQHGQFLLTTTSRATTEFSQAQVINNQVKFVHDGTIIAPEYKISVYDGVVTTAPPASVSVTFYKAPNLLVNSLTVSQGQTVLVANTTLHASAAGTDDPSALVFAISNLQHGHFSLLSTPNTAITSFTEQQIINSAVQFTHDNSQVAPSCLVSVSDGYAAALPSEMLVNFDIAPVLAANQLTIRQGEMVIMTNSMLSATDQDTNLEGLIFKVSNVQHGQFELGVPFGITTLMFMQKDIMASNVSFTHDGGLLAPTYSIAVSDGLVTIAYQPALVTFLPTTESVTSHTVRDALISTALCCSFGIGLWLFKKYIDRKTNKEFAGNDIQNLVCLAMLKRIKVSGILDYMSVDVIRDLRKAVSELFKTLLNIGVKLNIDNMILIEQNKLVDEIVRQTEKILLPESTCCHKFARFFKDYFVAEFTPEQIERQVKKIATAVKTALAKTNLSDSEMALATISKDDVFTKNPLASASLASVYMSSTSAINSASAASLEQKDPSFGRDIKDRAKQNLQAIRKEHELLLSQVREFEQVMQDNGLTGMIPKVSAT